MNDRQAPTAAPNEPNRDQEPVSALVDGELDARAAGFLIRRVAEDDGLRGRWQRLHLIRACIQREFTGPSDLVERVQYALEGESLPAPRRRAGPLLRYGMGGAIAASVALVAVVGLGNRLDQENLQESGVDDTPGFVSETTALDRQFSPQAVPAGYGGAPATVTPAEAAASDRNRQRINRYMIRHSQLSGGNGFISFTPVLTAPETARVVEQDAETAARAEETPVARD